MNKWNIQSEKDIWNEPIDWTSTYYSVILKDGREREVRTYKDECADGYIITHYEYTDDDSGVDFDDILLWKRIEKHDYEGMVEKFKAAVDSKTEEELAELFEEPEESVSEDLEKGQPVNIYYKTEGNIIYPDESMLTWGPFYFHSETKAKEKMEDVLKDITEWCNKQDPSLNIAPTNVIRCYGGTQIVFQIQAWKDENTIQECNGIVLVEHVVFEDKDDAKSTEKEQLIKKACEWLRENVENYEALDTVDRTYYQDIDNLVLDFKKAIEE